MPIHFDESSYPNIRITLTGEIDAVAYEQNNQRLIACMQTARKAGRKIGVVVDGRDSTPPGARERRDMAKFMEDYGPLMAVTLYGQVIVLSNALQRGVLTAILWIKPFPMPHHVTATPEEGLRWLEAQRRVAA